MRVAPIFLSALLSAVAVRPAAGQLDSALATVPHHARLRLQLLDSTEVMGRIQSREQQRVLLRTVVRPTVTRAYFEDRTVPLDSVARAWVGAGSHWQRGALVGLAVGTMSAYVALHGWTDSDECSELCIFTGSIIGAGLPGAVLGALAGGGTVRWRPLHPRE